MMIAALCLFHATCHVVLGTAPVWWGGLVPLIRQVNLLVGWVVADDTFALPVTLAGILVPNSMPSCHDMSSSSHVHQKMGTAPFDPFSIALQRCPAATALLSIRLGLGLFVLHDVFPALSMALHPTQDTAAG